MIDEADRDGDGEVNEEEFLRIMKTLGKKLQPVSIRERGRDAQLLDIIGAWV